MAKSKTAKMYMKPSKENPQFEFGCYSERGLMSYFMFVELPELMPKFLKALRFPNCDENLFEKIKNEDITNAIIFSELDLGKTVGFGCPDGAIYFEYKKGDETISTMILIEVKANETYEESCKLKETKKKIDDPNEEENSQEYEDGYNSTIKGQLELRWRMKELLLNKCFCDNKLTPYSEGKKYLREIESMRDFYTSKKSQPHDEFYTENKKEAKNPLASWRRLIINETGKDNDKSGVKKFIDELQKCKNEEVYFLVISKDTENPFDKVSDLQCPRCFTIKKKSHIQLEEYSCKELSWENAKRQFCWLPITEIEDFTEKYTQYQNAANDGDKLKHPLICDVLKLCIANDWKNIVYAETHAGAGVYDSSNQKVKKNILSLMCKYVSAKDCQKDNYYAVLKDFWTNTNDFKIEPNSIKYAGSALLAAIILNKAKNDDNEFLFTLRLTENDAIPFLSLKECLKKVLPESMDLEDKSLIRQDNFKKNLEWLTLTENQESILFIDPYRLSESSNEKGGFCKETLKDILTKMKEKDSIVGLWFSTDRDSNQKKLPDQIKSTIVDNCGVNNFRLFSYGIFKFYWIGFGKGVDVVKKMHNAENLQKRWFGLPIKEEPNV